MRRVWPSATRRRFAAGWRRTPPPPPRRRLRPGALFTSRTLDALAKSLVCFAVLHQLILLGHLVRTRDTSAFNVWTMLEAERLVPGLATGLDAQWASLVFGIVLFGAVFVAWNDEDAQRWIARAGSDLDAGERDRYRRALEGVRRRGYSVAIATSGPVNAETVETLARPPESEDARRARDELIREVMHSAYLATDLDAKSPVRVGQLSAPVFDRRGVVVASLLVPGPEREISSTELRALSGQLLEAATRATRAAGGRPPGELLAAG